MIIWFCCRFHCCGVYLIYPWFPLSFFISFWQRFHRRNNLSYLSFPPLRKFHFSNLSAAACSWFYLLTHLLLQYIVSWVTSQPYLSQHLFTTIERRTQTKITSTHIYRVTYLYLCLLKLHLGLCSHLLLLPHLWLSALLYRECSLLLYIHNISIPPYWSALSDIRNIQSWLLTFVPLEAAFGSQFPLTALTRSEVL